jgi:protein-tyrosine-phosphatase
MNRVLLLCKDNSIFSPIAEAYCKELTGEDTEVYSAGVEEAGIHPVIVKIMKDEGIDLSKFKSHSVHEFKHIDFDYILTFDSESEHESHHFPSKSIKYHYDFDKMIHEDSLDLDKTEEFQNIREKIKKNIKIFVKEHLTKT